MLDAGVDCGKVVTLGCKHAEKANVGLTGVGPCVTMGRNAPFQDGETRRKRKSKT